MRVKQREGDRANKVGLSELLNAEIRRNRSGLEILKTCPLWRYDQCDQIGQFFKVLVNNFAWKSSPKTLESFWAVLKYITFSKTAVASIWATFGNIWATFLLQYLVTLLPTYLPTYPPTHLPPSLCKFFEMLIFSWWTFV